MVNERPPRVIVVMNARWPRALLRAALREEGYDAVGAAQLEFALRYAAHESGRGPVAGVLLDADTDPFRRAAALDALIEKHGHPAVVLVAPAGRKIPGGPWSAIVRRPVSVGELVAAVQRLLPLPREQRHPLTG